MALMTGAEARVYIRGISGSAEDTNIGTLIDRVDAMIAAYIGLPKHPDGTFSVGDGNYILYLTGDGTKTLQLPVIPTTAIGSIYDDPDLAYDDSADLVASSDYTLYSNEGLVILDKDSTHAAWSTTHRALKVTMTGGFATAPDEVKHACGMQVAHMWTGRDHVGRSKISQGGGSIDVAPLSLLPEVRRALAPWRMSASWVG